MAYYPIISKLLHLEHTVRFRDEIKSFYILLCHFYIKAKKKLIRSVPGCSISVFLNSLMCNWNIFWLYPKNVANEKILLDIAVLDQ